MRTNSKILGALAVAGVVAATGSAFTASNTVVSSVAGYGTNTVTGATSTGVTHTLSGDGDHVVSSVVTFGASQAGRTVVAGFGTTDLETCVVTTTTATCTYANGGYVTADATAFNVAVS